MMTFNVFGRADNKKMLSNVSNVLLVKQPKHSTVEHYMLIFLELKQ